MTTLNDLVHQSVMIAIANRIANSARQYARQWSKRIPRSIRVGNVNSTQATASISITLDTTVAPQAAAFEHGADPHLIVARNAPFLIFEGTNMFAGQTIVTPSVNHPGIAPRPFVKPAVENNREWAKQQIKEAAGRGFRLAIRAMAKKI